MDDTLRYVQLCGHILHNLVIFDHLREAANPLGWFSWSPTTDLVNPTKSGLGKLTQHYFQFCQISCNRRWLSRSRPWQESKLMILQYCGRGLWSPHQPMFTLVTDRLQWPHALKGMYLNGTAMIWILSIRTEEMNTTADTVFITDKQYTWPWWLSYKSYYLCCRDKRYSISISSLLNKYQHSTIYPFSNSFLNTLRLEVMVIMFSQISTKSHNKWIYFNFSMRIYNKLKDLLKWTPAWTADAHFSGSVCDINFSEH